jgi:ABC-type multidrug transport system permease subunit
MLRSAARIELAALAQHRLFLALTVLAASSLLVLVSLFALTGSDAPLAVVDEDHGEYARRFVEAMRQVPHAFVLKPMDAEAARRALGRGRLVGAITLPAGFEAAVRRGETVPLEVQVDNLNEDLLFDLQRALPSAVLGFGHAVGLPGLRATIRERDLLPHDIPFLKYLAVSALALVAFVIAAALAALAVAREWEHKTLKLLRLSPASLGAVLAGKLAASGAVAAVAVLGAAAIVMAGYGVVPASPLAAIGLLVVCVVLFSSLGAWIGALFRRTLPIVPLVFGLAMPLFIDCGALEPTRFDGERIWVIAHLSPLYYAVGVLEWAFFGVRVTPEPIAVDVAVLLVLTAASALLAVGVLQRASARSRAWR